MSKFGTGIGRLIDLRHRSNRYIVVATFVGGFGTLIWRWSNGLDDVLLWAFRAAAAVFLAWAIGRELDPDETMSAGVATVIVLPLLALGDRPSFESARIRGRRCAAAVVLLASFVIARAMPGRGVGGSVALAEPAAPCSPRTPSAGTGLRPKPASAGPDPAPPAPGPRSA